MFTDACDTYPADFLQVLYPLLNLYNGSGTPKLVNQFTAGWKVSMVVGDSWEVAEILMAVLRQGWPAGEAILQAIAAWNLADINTFGGDDITSEMIGIHGDPYAKVAGVYTGSNSRTMRWFR